MKGTKITLELKTEIPLGENHVIIVHTNKEDTFTKFWTGWWIDENKGVHNNICNHDIHLAIEAHVEMCELIRSRVEAILLEIEQPLDWVIAEKMHTPKWDSNIGKEDECS